MSSRQKLTEVMILPSIEDIAYAAGFFDGEGSCSMQNTNCFTVSVAQHDVRPLEWMVLRWAGTLQYGAGNGKSINWRINKAEDIKRFLSDILPYLKVKNETVTVVLAAIDLSPLARRSAWENFKKGNHTDGDD